MPHMCPYMSKRVTLIEYNGRSALRSQCHILRLTTEVSLFYEGHIWDMDTYGTILRLTTVESLFYEKNCIMNFFI
jgi:hypothetical protein